MRVCPECGNRDPLYWRPLRWDPDDCYCQIEDFQRLEPELSLKLLKGAKEVHDKFYAYRLAGKEKNFVRRRELLTLKYYGWRTRLEKKHDPNKELPQGQRVLNIY